MLERCGDTKSTNARWAPQPPRGKAHTEGNALSSTIEVKGPPDWNTILLRLEGGDYAPSDATQHWEGGRKVRNDMVDRNVARTRKKIEQTCGSHRHLSVHPLFCLVCDDGWTLPLVWEFNVAGWGPSATPQLTQGPLVGIGMFFNGWGYFYEIII
jgi:hypothetical protein